MKLDIKRTKFTAHIIDDLESGEVWRISRHLENPKYKKITFEVFQELLKSKPAEKIAAELTEHNNGIRSVAYRNFINANAMHWIPIEVYKHFPKEVVERRDISPVENDYTARFEKLRNVRENLIETAQRKRIPKEMKEFFKTYWTRAGKIDRILEK